MCYGIYIRAILLFGTSDFSNPKTQNCSDIDYPHKLFITINFILHRERVVKRTKKTLFLKNELFVRMKNLFLVKNVYLTRLKNCFSHNGVYAPVLHKQHITLFTL